MKCRKKGFRRLNRGEYEFLLEKRAIAKKNGDFHIDKRLRAVTLVGYKGIKQKEAAVRCETHPRNLNRWIALYREGGYEKLTNLKYEGRPSRLSPEQLERLDKIVEADPPQQGYDTGIWTAAMIMEVIFKEFGVNYSASMVQKILRKLGFSFKLTKKNSPGPTLRHKRGGWMKNYRK